MEVEQIFKCHQVDHEKRVTLATFSFQDDAMTWWIAYAKDLSLHHNLPIKYWNELRSTLRKIYIQSYYDGDLMQKLHRLTHKDLIVDQYRQKNELLMLRASIREEPRLIIAHFQSGLNFKIRDKVQLLPYNDFNDLVQFCVG